MLSVVRITESESEPKLVKTKWQCMCTLCKALSPCCPLGGKVWRTLQAQCTCTTYTSCRFAVKSPTIVAPWVIFVSGYKDLGYKDLGISLLVADPPSNTACRNGGSCPYRPNFWLWHSPGCPKHAQRGAEPGGHDLASLGDNWDLPGNR